MLFAIRKRKKSITRYSFLVLFLRESASSSRLKLNYSSDDKKSSFLFSLPPPLKSSPPSPFLLVQKVRKKKDDEEGGISHPRHFFSYQHFRSIVSFDESHTFARNKEQKKETKQIPFQLRCNNKERFPNCFIFCNFTWCGIQRLSLFYTKLFHNLVIFSMYNWP